ncbi:4081_t:CDS:2 [Paraglomus occultum]|uniref:4081_t:CDS:1 n=1 Tax=Paraglomus occultum TaxID=144539 RepID=A0A9N9B6P4_9GLOM|nr:4081_t:CDS:2 [Paraglomus occultum]
MDVSEDFITYDEDLSMGFDISESEETEPTIIDPAQTSNCYNIRKAEDAMQKLKKIIKDDGWQPVVKHKSGVVVCMKSGGEEKIPIFKGEGIIKGHSPQAVFAVIGMRKLWDDWYEEGNLVENLNDTTSLTYMVMKGLTGSKSRDLSLVEKIECLPTGTICFVSTSVETPKVPRISSKVRAILKLNGWILEPLATDPPSTKVIYILQTDVRGWVPGIVAKKYLTRRPFVINAINNYLQKNDPPAVIISTTPPPSHPPSRKPSKAQLRSARSVRRRRSISNQSSETYREIKTSVDLNALTPTVPETDTDPVDVTSDLNATLAAKSLISPFPSPPPSSPSATLKVTASNASLKTPSDSTKPDAAFKVADTKEGSKVADTKAEQHRHIDKIQAALAAFKKQVEDKSGWQFHAESKGVKTYMKDIPGKSMPMMRGEQTFKGHWTADDILAVINSLDFRPFWDDRYEDGEVVERLGTTDMLLRTSMKGSFLVSGRDLSVCATVDRDPVTGAIWTIGTSVVDPKIPETRKYVRADLDMAGWYLKPQFDSNGFVTAVEIVYVVGIDIKLDVVPSVILKQLSSQTPMCVGKVCEAIQTYGHPPYIASTTGAVTYIKFDIKLSKYDLKMTDMNGGSVELRLCRKIYASGFDVSIKPEVATVEVLADNTDVVRITIPAKPDCKDISIKVTKNIENGFQMTYNGKYTIPVADPKSDLKSVPDTSSTRSTTLNEQVTNDDTSSLPKSEPSRQINTVSPATIRSDQDIPRELLQRKPPTDAERAAFYRELVRKKSTLENAKPEKVETSKATYETKTTYESDDTIATTPVEKGKISDVIIPLDKTQFNTHQVALMLAAMLLAFYTGKLSGCISSITM